MTSIRKALGTVKDQTTISIAKVSSNFSPDLEVAIVKATSHDDDPASEKHIREILTLTSGSRPDVADCVATISRRLGKTRDWVVALKALVLLHRLLSDGDRGFQEEILHATRRGARLLSMSDFRDEAHSSSWDLSAFVRTYALYLDQRLECDLFDRKQKRGGGGRGGEGNGKSYSDYRDTRRSEHERSRSYSSSPPPSNDGGRRGDKKPLTPPREMKPESLLSRMQQLQLLLDRFLACRPTGKAKSSRMVLVALYPIVKESFQLYADICETLAVLVDRFNEMDYGDCSKAFEAYSGAAKQIDELVGFYGWCKDVGVARSSEYPEVQRISDNLLETLEGFVRDKVRSVKSPDKGHREAAAVLPLPAPPAEEPSPDSNTIKALPAPADYEEKKVPEKQPEVQKKQQQTGELVDLREGAMSAGDHENKLALALFSAGGSTTVNTDGKWEAFPSTADEQEFTSAWQTPAAEAGKADWELALVETASNLSKQKAAMGGGLDPVLLEGMYDQGVVRQQVNAQMAGGSSSSVALPGLGTGKANPVLALPAPDGTVTTIGQDPFAASLTVPPPAFVQMAEIEKKQQLVVQEQMLWQQYARDGMQGQASLAKLSVGYNNQLIQPMPYGLPPLSGGGFYQAPN